MFGNTFLSVVMPVHNGAEWIAATLDSVAGEATHGTEIIVVDSSTTDDTAEITERYAERLRLRLVRRPDLSAWQVKTNLGVVLSSAEHVCILHQDDLWLPGRVNAVRRWMATAPNATLHLAPTLIVDRHTRPVGRWTCPLPYERELQAEFFLRRLLVQNFVSVPAPVFSRTAWLECSGMDEKLWYTPDWDVWAKLSSAGPVVYHKDLTTAFRVHGSSLTMRGSRNASDFRAQMETVLERHLHRLPCGSRDAVERSARVSIDINVSLAAALAGDVRALVRAALDLLSLGPVGMGLYLRHSRLRQRILSRLRARALGAF